MTARLRLTGLLRNPRVLDRNAIIALPGNVPDVTRHASGAVGAAVRVGSVVATAGPDPEATHATVISADGSYRASIPIAVLVAGGWLAHSLDGDVLPANQGGPLRLTVAEGRTLCWNVKDVGELHFTAGPEPDSVPANPPH